MQMVFILVYHFSLFIILTSLDYTLISPLGYGNQGLVSYFCVLIRSLNNSSNALKQPRSGKQKLKMDPKKDNN